MNIELSEDRRQELEKLYLRRELYQRDIAQLQTSIQRIESELAAKLTTTISQYEDADIAALNPEFDDYKLTAMGAPDWKVSEKPSKDGEVG